MITWLGGPDRRKRRAKKITSPSRIRLARPTGRPTTTEPDPGRGQGLADAEQGRAGLIELRARIPATGGLDGRRRGRQCEQDAQGSQAGLVLEMRLLGAELLDLALHVAQLRLDLQDVGNLRGPGHDRLEGGLGGPQVVDPGAEVEDLPGDLDRIRLGRVDLRGEAIDRVEGVLPAGNGDPVGDRGHLLVALVGLVGVAHIAAHPDDRGANLEQRRLDLRNLDRDRSSPHDVAVRAPRGGVAGRGGCAASGNARGRLIDRSSEARRRRRSSRRGVGCRAVALEGAAAGRCGRPRAGGEDHHDGHGSNGQSGSPVGDSRRHWMLPCRRFQRIGSGTGRRQPPIGSMAASRIAALTSAGR